MIGGILNMSENNQKHIFQNSFYKKDPLPTWSWEVYFDFGQFLSWDRNGTFTRMGSFLLPSSIKNIKIPDLKVETLDVYYPGYKVGHPSKPTMNGQMTLEFYDNDKLEVRKALETLQQLNYNPYIGNPLAPTGDLEKIDVVKNDLTTFNIIVKLLNPVTNKVIGQCKYYSCFVQSVSDLSLDYSGNDALNVSAVIDYKYFKTITWDTEENTKDE